MQKQKEMKAIEKIKKLDQVMAELNCDVSFVIKKIYLGLTADKNDPFIPN